MYSAFSRREIAVNMPAVRAGSPPSAIEMLLRFHRLDRFDQLHEFWETWETWFAELEESHTSLAALVFFRSPQPEHSWVTSAGTVLDADRDQAWHDSAGWRVNYDTVLLALSTLTMAPEAPWSSDRAPAFVSSSRGASDCD